MTAEPGDDRAAETFRGRLRFPGEGSVEADLTVGEEELAVAIGGEGLGSWPLTACRAARDGSGFRLSVDGEEVWFEPREPDRFARAAVERFAASTLAERIGIMRTIPGDGGSAASVRRTAPGPGDGRVRWRHRTRRAGFVVSALAAGALAAALGLGPAGEPPPTLGGEPPAPSAATDRPAEVFSLTPEAFAARWNDTADELGVELRLLGVSGPEDFEVRPSSRLLVQATVGVDGMVDAFVLTVDPAGTGEENVRSLASWGVAIAVASPELGPEGRRRLLAELGFDVDEPGVTGLDGEAVVGGVRYSMRYLEGFRTVLFTVEPG